MNYLYAAVASILLLLGAYWLGGHEARVKHDAQASVATKIIKNSDSVQVNNTAKVQTEVVNTIRQELVKGDEIIKKVPIYVPIQQDSACPISNGFVSLWNASNRGESVSDTPSSVDGETSGVKLSDVETQHATESAYTRELEAKVNGWIDWYSKAKEIADKAKKDIQ